MTPQQLRVLRYCGDWAHWISLADLDRRLPPDDVLTVPSLVEEGMLEHHVMLRTVRITKIGRRRAEQADN